jgi:hypothetical protein
LAAEVLGMTFFWSLEAARRAGLSSEDLVLLANAAAKHSAQPCIADLHDNDRTPLRASPADCASAEEQISRYGRLHSELFPGSRSEA